MKQMAEILKLKETSEFKLIQMRYLKKGGGCKPFSDLSRIENTHKEKVKAFKLPRFNE